MPGCAGSQTGRALDKTGSTAYQRFEGFFQYQREDLDGLSKKTYKLMEEVSPINHLRKGAPPTLLRYNGPLDTPFGIHHASFGQVIKDRMDLLGAHCDLIAGGKPVGDSKPATIAGFLKEHLGV